MMWFTGAPQLKALQVFIRVESGGVISSSGLLVSID
jgi:hypothetical protein